MHPGIESSDGLPSLLLPFLIGNRQTTDSLAKLSLPQRSLTNESRQVTQLQHLT